MHPRRDAAHQGSFPVEHGELPTAAAMVATLFLNGDAETQAADWAPSVALIGSRPPVWNASVGSVDGVYWLFASDALRQTNEAAFTAWSDAIDAAILPHQRTGEDAGSWDPVSAWAGRGGRPWATAIMVLNLQAPYRFR